MIIKPFVCLTATFSSAAFETSVVPSIKFTGNSVSAESAGSSTVTRKSDSPSAGNTWSTISVVNEFVHVTLFPASLATILPSTTPASLIPTTLAPLSASNSATTADAPPFFTYTGTSTVVVPASTSTVAISNSIVLSVASPSITRSTEGSSTGAISIWSGAVDVS